ncbi:MAG: hypothetical protein AAF752_05485, partial [Bacteroidota bacterium]
MYHALRLFLLLALLQPASAQFIRSAGGPAEEIRTTAASNGSGGVYVAVSTESPAFTYETGGTPAAINFTGDRETAILEYDDAGNVLQELVLTSTQRVDVVDMVPDGSGGIWVVGIYQGTADFNPGPGSTTRTSNLFATFVVRYTAAGVLDTIFVLPENVLGLGIAIDPTTNGP